MQIGENIRKYRKAKNMTQEEMAKRLGGRRRLISGRTEFPIVKDTTPNMTNPRLYRTAKDIKA